MTFAAIADIHGNLPALEATLDDIRKRGIEAVVNLGDLLSGPLWPVETADLLQPLSFATVRGNHERQLLTLPPATMGPSDQYTIGLLSKDHLNWLATLPSTLRYSAEVFLCHGTPQDDVTYFLHEVRADGSVHEAGMEAVKAHAQSDAPLILCGHTHIPALMRLGDGRCVVNPGSVGLPAYTDEVPYPHRMQAGTPHASYAILVQSGNEWNVEHVCLTYDWESAARQAERNQRPDWARALRTGNV